VGKVNGTRECAPDDVPTLLEAQEIRGAFAHPANATRKKKAAVAAASFFLSHIRY
jgi:hypothetical protein